MESAIKTCINRRDIFLNYQKFLTKLREFIVNHNYYLHADKKTQTELCNELIIMNFNYHYSNNKFYRDLCNEQGVFPETIIQEGIEKIPLIPIKMFKDKNAHLLMTKKPSEIELEIRSTGTSGIPSVARRDKDSVDNLGFILISLYREYFTISHGCGLFLCPSPAEIPEMGMVKAFNFLSGLLDDRIYLVKRYSFMAENALKILREWDGRFTRYIVGPPFMINRLLKYMKNNDIRIRLDRKSKIITLGGWKRFTGEQISRETFDDLCREFLGIEKHQIRDMYGLVECNFLAIECEKGFKHVPPWVKIIVRELNNPTKVISQTGKSGVITILDPTNLSYPCFIQTEDIGCIDNEDVCSCNRLSQTLSFKRRITGAELGCCAVNLEKYMEEDEISQVCEL